MGRILVAPFSAAAILQTGYLGFPRTNPFPPMIRKFTLKSRNLARSITADGVLRISGDESLPSNDPKIHAKIDEPRPQYGSRRKGRGQQRKSSVSPYSHRSDDQNHLIGMLNRRDA